MKRHALQPDQIVPDAYRALKGSIEPQNSNSVMEVCSTRGMEGEIHDNSARLWMTANESASVNLVIRRTCRLLSLNSELRKWPVLVGIGYLGSSNRMTYYRR